MCCNRVAELRFLRWMINRRDRLNTSVSRHSRVMHTNHPRPRRDGFSNRSERLIVVAVLAVISAFVLPVALKLHLSIWSAVGIIAGAFGLFVVWLQHRNILDWLKGCRWRKKNNDA